MFESSFLLPCSDLSCEYAACEHECRRSNLNYERSHTVLIFSRRVSKFSSSLLACLKQREMCILHTYLVVLKGLTSALIHSLSYLELALCWKSLRLLLEILTRCYVLLCLSGFECCNDIEVAKLALHVRTALFRSDCCTT